MEANAKEDIEVIRRLMEDTRREAVDRGTHLLIWGVLPAVGLIATYVKAVGGGGPAPQWTWLAVLTLGWVASMTVGWREGRTAPVTTPGGRVLSATWIAAAVSLTLIGLGGMFGPLVDVAALPALISAIMGAPVLITSLLTRHAWLAMVAVGWWVGGGVMLFLPGAYTLLLMAGMALLLSALPGAVLRASARRQQKGDVSVAESA